jgi:hypothetical protein
MRLVASGLVLVLGLALCAGCAGDILNLPEQEGQEMQKSGSRIPAPIVEPIVSGGIRYEQVKNGLLAGFDQMGGLLTAYDEESGEQLWTLKVYDNKRDPEREGDVQDVFFKSMTLQDDGTLLIENERGARFIVDPAEQTVTPAP